MNKYLLLLLPLFFAGCDNKPTVVNIPDTINLAVKNPPKENFERYVIYDHPNSTSEILLDKETGRSWKYFRTLTSDGNNIQDEGWTPLEFQEGSAKGDTPEEADESLVHPIPGHQ